ncbi:MAG: hypothetical protein ACYDD0_02450 [Candidatus Dormibacteria bacterium]
MAGLCHLARDLDLAATVERHRLQPGNQAPCAGTSVVMATVNQVRLRRVAGGTRPGPGLRDIPDQTTNRYCWRTVDLVPEAVPGAITGEAA